MSFSVEQIVQWTRGKLVNEEMSSDGFSSLRVRGPAALGEAQSDHLAFFFSKDYQAQLLKGRPGILITGDAFVEPLKNSGLPLWKTTAVIASDDPYLAMARLSEKFVPSHDPSELKIDPRAIIHPTAQIASYVRIGAGAVIDARVKIGSGTVIYPGVFVGADSTVGESSTIFSNVSIYEGTQVGNRVRIHAGSVIGADGFGYAPVRNESGEVTSHQKIHHFGRVVLGDDVEVGANSCIDRGTYGDTLIGNDVKIDNLVQVGHNCEVGQGSVLCGNVGLAGSAVLGKFVYVGGGAGIGNKVRVGDRAMIGAYGVIKRNVEPGIHVTGDPQREIRSHLRAQAILNRLIAEKEKGRSQ